MTSTMQRRTPLANSLVAGAALAIAPRTSFATTNLNAARMRFGVVTYLWGKDMDLPELLSSCEKSDVLGVELRTEHKHGVEPELSKAARTDVRKRFSDSPVELIGYGSNCEYHYDDPAKVKQNIEQSKRYIELMHD